MIITVENNKFLDYQHEREMKKAVQDFFSDLNETFSEDEKKQIDFFDKVKDFLSEQIKEQVNNPVIRL